ncbi:MAG: ABC transporter substrate-binding protein, partial [Prevotella sp.]|nr:ABC transporter substrate-binding protein [Prevotella sp.]
MRPLLYLLLATVLLSSCGRQTAARQDGGDTVAFKYARRLSVVRHDGYTEVTLQNPWQTDKTLHRYLLVPHDAPLPE